MSEFIFDEISATEQGQSHRTVRITERADLPNQLYQVVAFLGTYNVRISRMSDDTRAKSFQLNAEEMDTLAAQWMLFREDCISAREAEEKRVEGVKEQVIKLAVEHDLQIERDEQYPYGDKWDVYTADRDWLGTSRTYDDLLESVSNAIKTLDENKRKMWWQDAMDIAQKYPAIHIQDRRDFGQSGWNVTADDVQFGKIAHSSEELFHLVKEVQAFLDHQSTIATNSFATPDIDSQQNSTVTANQ